MLIWCTCAWYIRKAVIFQSFHMYQSGDYIGADAIIQLDGYTQLLDYVSDVDEY